MAARSPRHLGERPRRLGLSRLQLVFLAGAVTLALVTGTIGLLARDAGRPERRAGTPTTAPRGGGAATSAAPTSTAPPDRPIRATPGNLLANGDFERDLGGWAPLGGASLERVRGGVSGRWAVAVGLARPGSGTQAPGLALGEAAPARPGQTYEASVWVRPAAPGAQVVLALRELVHGRVAASDVAGYWLAGAGWRQLAVKHRARVPGSTLALEITGVYLPADGRLLVDAVAMVAE